MEPAVELVVSASDVVAAPAKLTVALSITGVRADGYHLLDAEMVTVDLCDRLEFRAGQGVEVVDEVTGGAGIADLDGGEANLVTRALALCDRQAAAVRLVKRIPVGAGLGGGSADAAAVLRWAGRRDLSLAARLGADVPFCLIGGRARVTGVGEEVTPLGFEERRYLLLLPPLSVDTAAAYRAWDAGARGAPDAASNDLEAAALVVAPALAAWRRALAEATGARPRLAGSGSAFFVEDDDGDLAVRLGHRLELGGGAEWAPVVSVRTVPAPG